MFHLPLEWVLAAWSGCCLPLRVRERDRNRLLKGVSRSFYLSLRMLPQPMRQAAGLGYLLARTSDSVADAARAPEELRLQSLEGFRRAVAGETGVPRWSHSLMNAVPDWRERNLLESGELLFGWLEELPDGEAELVREVVDIIIGGQRMDLEVFAGAGGGNPVALPDEAALDDYTWRVAGCVGAFWTRLGFLTMGSRYSSVAESELLERGIAYGKGLQLVNILRDLPVDLAAGRCYLPVENPLDPASLIAAHRHWLERARAGVAEGRAYAATLPSRRLRAATLLPAMIADETLDAMDGLDWEGLQKRVKIPRTRVYLALVRAFR